MRRQALIPVLFQHLFNAIANTENLAAFTLHHRQKYAFFTIKTGAVIGQRFGQRNMRQIAQINNAAALCAHHGVGNGFQRFIIPTGAHGKTSFTGMGMTTG